MDEMGLPRFQAADLEKVMKFNTDDTSPLENRFLEDISCTIVLLNGFFQVNGLITFNIMSEL